MGQAKARGTKEQRIIDGERKAFEKAQAQLKARQEHEAAMTPEDREKRKKAQMLLATMLAFTAPEVPRYNKYINSGLNAY